MIYGTSNKAGMSFAYYLMSKGFNLILIERDSESIKNLVIKLHQMLPESKSIIIQAVLNSFDQDSLNKAVGDYVTLPVKIFVNCKSSKRTQTKKKQDPREIQERREFILRNNTSYLT